MTDKFKHIATQGQPDSVRNMLTEELCSCVINEVNQYVEEHDCSYTMVINALTKTLGSLLYQAQGYNSAINTASHLELDIKSEINRLEDLKWNTNE